MARQDQTNRFTQPQALWNGFTGGDIKANADLDDVGPGVWECMSNADAETLKNAPFDGNAFYLFCAGTKNAYEIQIAYHYAGAEMASRRREPGVPNPWSKWLIVSYDQHWDNGVVPDGADIGSYKIAGRYSINGSIVNGPLEGKIIAMLEVDTLAGIVRQKITTMNGDIFINTYSGDPSEWSGWKKVTTTSVA